MRPSKFPALRNQLENEPGQLRDVIDDFHLEDIADAIEDMPEEQIVSLVSVLPPAMGAEVLERMVEGMGAEILGKLTVESAAALLTEMASDDRADLLQGLSEEFREQILASIEETEPAVAEDMRILSAYGEETAGGIMTTDYVALWPELTVEQAIAELRRTASERVFETIYYIYVVAYERLVGVLSLRDLILSAPEKAISSVMTDNVVRVHPSTDQEQVATTMAKYDLSAIPVVDDQGHMLGVVTIDDVVDVVIDEATEDAHQMGGVSPIEDTYLDTSFGLFIRKRITWLVVLFVGELLTASVMDHYQAQLALLVDLVIFVPLIISSGGNSGSQSSALIIRAIALGELTPADWWVVFRRELGMGLVLGSSLGVLGFLRAYFGANKLPALQMGVTVGFAVVAVVTLGTVLGSILPLAIRRLGLDPAVSSTPFVASLVDVLGLALYFSSARLIFAAML